jgi:hypothetical protein
VNSSFGDGCEGVFVQPTSGSEKALIIGRSIPWWGMVVAWVDLRIHSILLNELRFSSLVSAYFRSNIPVKKNVDQYREDAIVTRQAICECSVVAMESLPRPISVLSEMWVKAGVRLILLAHEVLIPPPPGWKLCQKQFSHAEEVGGVTDIAAGNIGVYYRSDKVNAGSVLCSSPLCESRPPRDCRSVLKMAFGGNRCGPPVKHNQKSQDGSIQAFFYKFA